MSFVSEETARRIADSLERLEGELARLAGSRSPAEKPSDAEREPLKSLLEKARNHVMSDVEIAQQRASWARQDMD